MSEIVEQAAPARNPVFAAIEKVGQSVDDALVTWVQGFAMLDYYYWNELEKALGAREALIIYSKVWEDFALGELPHVLEALNITTIDMAAIGRISRAYWESIACAYEAVEDTPERHVGVITTCPYWDNMQLVFGKEKASEMTHKCMAATSSNYYQAIVKALGKWDEIYATQDKFMCDGDDICRVVFEKRKK